jgi:hypothetical protein
LACAATCQPRSRQHLHLQAPARWQQWAT